MTRASHQRAVDERMLHIGEVANLTGLSLRTIRHYEEVGIVVPSGRTSGGFRLFTGDDVERLRRVMGMKPIGFSLDEIREVLDLIDGMDAGTSSAVEADRLALYSALATERLEKHRLRLGHAERFTEELSALVDPDEGPSPS